MKILNPTVSIVMASHMKAEYLESTINSVILQTRRDLQLIIVDSGEWIERRYHVHVARDDLMGKLYDRFSPHPMIEWYSLGEPPGLIDRACPYAYVWNLAIRRLVRGKYVCFFADDDVYETRFVEKMAGYLDANPQARAVYCAERRVRIGSFDMVIEVDVLGADTPRSTFDNYVDGLQMMVRRDVLDEMGDPWFNEDPDIASCRHADGQFMDRVGQIVGEVPNIPEILVNHRFTSISTYN